MSLRFLVLDITGECSDLGTRPEPFTLAFCGVASACFVPNLPVDFLSFLVLCTYILYICLLCIVICMHSFHSAHICIVYNSVICTNVFNIFLWSYCSNLSAHIVYRPLNLYVYIFGYWTLTL